ncbi:MAG: DEAD/DEAH box helicase [Cellulomonadaceae bacterium]|jgi:superfamily II DNA or RNA helicase|nr:DEAD/DEAH box helicase [Cellulomonadaceae bacterium]
MTGGVDSAFDLFAAAEAEIPAREETKATTTVRVRRASAAPLRSAQNDGGVGKPVSAQQDGGGSPQVRVRRDSATPLRSAQNDEGGGVPGSQPQDGAAPIPPVPASIKLRAWQQEAFTLYHRKNARDFLAVATPGSGKTTFALTVASSLLANGTVRRITVVAPTEHLKTQWADAAARVGIRIDPNFRNAQARHGSHFIGVALTYAQVAANPRLHRSRTESDRTLVILDEVHHGGDALSWGDAIHEAFEDATRRLSLTGTPFRSDTAAIPFVTYTPDAQGIRRSAADYTYGYGEALRDHVVRPVLFMTYTGQMRWRTRAGDEVVASLGEEMTKDLTQQAWRTALDPHGEWIPAVLAAADKRLSEVRQTMPDAGALMIASDQTSARAYAGHLKRLTGKSPTVVLSDDDGASAKIDAFTSSTDRWMVAVRMVSEGVDVPRLAVGVYATSTQTPLFFAQAIGRYVRARRRGETATVFLPAVAPLTALASHLEQERDHALDRPMAEGEDLLDDAALAAANREEQASADLQGSFEAMESHATFDSVLFDGGHFGTQADVGSDEELDFLGLPGLLDPEQVAQLLRQRQAGKLGKGGLGNAAQGSGNKADADQASMNDSRTAAERRKELNKLVGAWARKNGSPHGQVHADLRRRCGGPEVPLATVAQLEARITQVRAWFVGGR